MKHLYFDNEDSEICYPLEDHLNEAKDNEVDQIEIFEAIPCKAKEYVWCSYLGICLERCECNKPSCNVYEKPKKGNICANRGRAFAHGKKVKFDVKTGKKIKQQNERA